MKLANGVNKALFVALTFVLLSVGQALGQAQTWSQLTPTGTPPTARASFGSALFDSATDRMMVFGGGTSSGNTNEVWVLTSADGEWGTPQWVKLSPAEDPTYGLPAPRKNQSQVYDPSSNRMIVFDGCSASCGSFLNDVWVLTNANGIGGTPAWIELFPAGGPPGGRSGQAAVYDPGTNSMIIFGGDSSLPANPTTYSDVWVLSNANGLGGTPTWTELSPTGGPPAGQAYGGAVYDPINNRMIVFGGYRQASVYSNATWALSNANGQGGTPVWTNLTAEGASGSPPATQGPTAVYDVASNRMTIFGGSDASETLYNGVWLLTDANGLGGTPTWMQLTPSGGPPAARAFLGAVFNPASARMTVFGGGTSTTGLNDTWVLTNANAVTGPVVGLSPIMLTFSGQGIGSTSSAQTVNLFDPGNAALTISAIAATGDFAETNDCGGTVAAESACPISVTFTPSTSGVRTGTLSFTDNASGSPQAVALSGTGQDFTLAVASGSSNSATVTPGSQATYTLSVTGQGGFDESVSFTCTGVPSEATCAAPSVTPGSSATNVTVTVTTTAPSIAGPRSRPLSPIPPPSPGLRGLLMVAFFLALLGWVSMRRTRAGVNRWQSTMIPLAAGLLLTLALPGCGGGGTSPPSNKGTSPGTYTLTVTGTAGSGSSALSHSVTLTLTVS
jgi:hypothetical protein